MQDEMILKNHKEAVDYLRGNGGTCDWQDMTVEISEKIFDACLSGLVDSCIETETWILRV